MTAPVSILRARVGETHIALELQSVVSLLDPAQAEHLEIIVVSAALGERYQQPAAVALLESPHGSVALGVDEINGYEHWDRSRVARVPEWLARHLPKILKPACGLGDDGKIVWIVDPPAFAAHRE